MTAAADRPDTAVILRPRLQRSDECLRPTRAEVDLDAIAYNLSVVRAVAGRARVLAVVKADAYGHGVIPVARRLQHDGIAGFGVALAEEGLELREAGIEADILVLNGVYGGAHADVLEAGLTPVVYELGDVAAFHRAAAGRPFSVHLKVDTGMSRLGVPLDRLDDFLARFARFSGARISGLMTHLACADSDDAFTALQLQAFTRAIHALRARGHRPKVTHAANSAATFRHPSARCDLVRTGLALYGYPGAPDVDLPLRPAMRLRTEVITMRDLPVGGRVGYDGTFVAERRTRLATLPLGYGDGLMRAVSNRGVVLVRGRRCPIVGNVSMDLTTIDVTDVPDVAIGDEVLLLGDQEGARVDADGLAQAAGTIPYEVLTNVSRRVPRFYRGG